MKEIKEMKEIKKTKQNKKKGNIFPIIVIIILIMMVVASIFLYIKNNEKKNHNNGKNNSAIKKVYVNKQFVFDDLDITVSGNYKIVKNVQDNNKEVIEIPVQVKNSQQIENSFSIGYVKIYNEKGEEIRELGSLFKDKSFENSPKLGKGEMTIKNVYIPYNGNGKYKMIFKTFYEEKEMEIVIKKIILNNL